MQQGAARSSSLSCISTALIPLHAANSSKIRLPVVAAGGALLPLSGPGLADADAMQSAVSMTRH